MLNVGTSAMTDSRRPLKGLKADEAEYTTERNKPDCCVPRRVGRALILV